MLSYTCGHVVTPIQLASGQILVSCACKIHLPILQAPLTDNALFAETIIRLPWLPLMEFFARSSSESSLHLRSLSVAQLMLKIPSFSRVVVSEATKLVYISSLILFVEAITLRSILASLRLGAVSLKLVHEIERVTILR